MIKLVKLHRAINTTIQFIEIIGVVSIDLTKSVIMHSREDELVLFV